MTKFIKAARAGLLIAIVLGTWEVCARIQDQVTLGVPALRLQYAVPALYAYDRTGPHGIPYAHDGKFRMNSIGFRGPELIDGRETILCLGASETFGIAETGGNEFPRQLERRLNSGNARFQVVNAAIPGERAEELVATLPRTLALTHPAYAVLYPSPASAVWTVERWNEMHPSPETKDPPEERLSRWRSFAHIRDVLATVVPEPIRKRQQEVDLAAKVASEIAASGSAPVSRLPAENFTEFRGNLDRTLAMLAAAHVRTIVVTHATRFGPDGERRDDQLKIFHTSYPTLTDDGLFDTERRFNAQLRAAARMYHVVVVDAARLIAPGPENFSDYFHFTDRGSARLASLIAAAIPRPSAFETAVRSQTRQ